MATNVPQSAPKYEFLAALGFSTNDATHMALYKTMKQEATRAYDAFMRDRANVLPEHRATGPPWCHAQFKDSTVRQAVASIYNNASPETSVHYQQGGASSDNWVCKWLLYHVCRYRDHRNGNRGVAESQMSPISMPSTPIEGPTPQGGPSWPKQARILNDTA